MSYLSRNDIKVKVKIVNLGNLYARATVIFFETIETHGWRLMKSTKTHPIFGEEIWIQSPSFKTNKGWKEIVYINDRKTWELVHEMIFDAYHMLRSKEEGIEGTKTNSEQHKPKEEDENFDDIPF